MPTTKFVLSTLLLTTIVPIHSGTSSDEGEQIIRQTKENTRKMNNLLLSVKGVKPLIDEARALTKKVKKLEDEYGITKLESELSESSKKNCPITDPEARRNFRKQNILPIVDKLQLQYDKLDKNEQYKTLGKQLTTINRKINELTVSVKPELDELTISDGKIWARAEKSPNACELSYKMDEIQKTNLLYKYAPMK